MEVHGSDLRDKNTTNKFPFFLLLFSGQKSKQKGPLSLEKHRLLFRNVRYKNKTPPSSSDTCFCYATLSDKSSIYFSNATNSGPLKYVSSLFQPRC